jgi:hypothetical protein
MCVRYWRPHYSSQASQVKHEQRHLCQTALKTRGPYRVINPSSYRLQKLPFLRVRRPGRFRKENGARIEKLPSTLILHRNVGGADTWFSQLHGEFADTPLYKWLGVLRHGAYQQAHADSSWAFEPLANMWTEAIDEDDESSSDDEDYNFDANVFDEDEDHYQQPTRYTSIHCHMETCPGFEPGFS